jgi:acyl dehydratase
VTQADALITAQARARIGAEIARSTGTVSKKEFQRFAAAVGDHNPLYFDRAYAQRHGYRDVVAPPMFLPYAVQGVVSLMDLRQDGTPCDDLLRDIPLPACRRRMAGGETWRFEEPIYDGDVITAIRCIEDIREKQGRSGGFVLILVRTTYLRSDQRLVAQSVTSHIARP